MSELCEATERLSGPLPQHSALALVELHKQSTVKGREGQEVLQPRLFGSSQPEKSTAFNRGSQAHCTPAALGELVLRQICRLLTAAL